MSDTPRTDAEEFEIPAIGAQPPRKVVEAWVARRFERELNDVIRKAAAEAIARGEIHLSGEVSK